MPSSKPKKSKKSRYSSQDQCGTNKSCAANGSTSTYNGRSQSKSGFNRRTNDLSTGCVKNDDTSLLLLTQPNKKFSVYFTNQEIAQIKTRLKLKDLSGLPFVIGATILNKTELLKKLLSDGYDINQPGLNNNMTALIWAIKHKLSDLVDYMLAVGADPTIKTASGDNAAIVALTDKYWTEERVIQLWRNGQFPDGAINDTTRNGHSALHLCVRRDWEDLLHLLMAQGANLDVPNVNGVTPLMTACFRNNPSIVQVLIDSGANVLKEDNHGRMALCYAISSAMRHNTNTTKNTSPIVDRILEEVQKYSTFSLYLKKILGIIVTNYELSEMFVNIIKYAVHCTEDGLQILLTLNIFNQLLKTLQDNSSDKERVKFLLQICYQVLLYNQDISAGFQGKIRNQMLDNLFCSGLPNLLLDLLQSSLTGIASLAFDLILLSCTTRENWIRKNFRKLLQFVKGPPPFRQQLDYKQYQILRTKLRKVTIQAEVMAKLRERHHRQNRQYDKNSTSDKRHKKIKSLEFHNNNNSSKNQLENGDSTSKTEYLEESGANKTPDEQKSKYTPIPLPLLTDSVYSEENNGIVNSIKRNILEENPYLNSAERNILKRLPQIHGDFPVWQMELLTMPFVPNTNISRDVSQAFETLKNSADDLPQRESCVTTILTYLRELLQLLIDKCRTENDNEAELLTQELQTTFDSVLVQLRKLAQKNCHEFMHSAQQLEYNLLNYQIEGKRPLLEHVCSTESVSVQFSTFDPFFDYKQYVTDVLNGRSSPKNDPKVLSIKRISPKLSTDEGPFSNNASDDDDYNLSEHFESTHFD